MWNINETHEKHGYFLRFIELMANLEATNLHEMLDFENDSRLMALNLRDLVETVSNVASTVWVKTYGENYFRYIRIIIT